MEEEQQEKETKPYKIMPNDEIIVHRQDVYKDENKYTFYNVKFKKRAKDGKDLYVTKGLVFDKDTDLLDGSTVKLIRFYEDSRENPRDKYNPIWFLRVLDYEVILDARNFDEQQSEYEAYQQIDDGFY